MQVTQPEGAEPVIGESHSHEASGKLRVSDALSGRPCRHAPGTSSADECFRR